MFFYWIPKTFEPEQIKADIGYAFEGAQGEAIKKEVLTGPGGNGNGWLIADRAWKPQLDRVKIDLEAQYWRKVPKSLAWVGCWRSDKLTPSTVQRSELVEGVGVELADGTLWQCAFARKFVEIDQTIVTLFGYTLPRVLELDDAGQWQPNKVAPRFERFVELANLYWEAACVAASEQEASSAGFVSFEFEQIDELAILGLSANYRVGPAELALCNAYDVDCRRRLIRAVMDEATFEDWSKKKIAAAQDGSDTSLGQNASTPAE